MLNDLPSLIVSKVGKLESKGPDAVVAVFGATGYYLYASPNHERAIGYTADELTKMHLSQVVDPAEHHAAWVLRTVSVLHSGPMKFTSHLIAKSGVRIKVSGTLQHVRDPGGARYFITSVRIV